MTSALPFYDTTRAELETWFTNRGQPAFRARQLFKNVYNRGLIDFEEMTDLPKELRTDLAGHWDLRGATEKVRRTSPDASATKILWGLADGKAIESVLMHADYGDTLCFSTQVGCAFQCSFCITGKMGRIRHLTAGEIVDQIFQLLRSRRHETGVNLVAMGMGEPMDNLDALLKAIEILGDSLGMNVSDRRITVSTVGIVPGIERLAAERPRVGLALSLNATTNEVRSEMMPVNRKYPIESLIAPLQAYAAAGKRRITLEYVMIRGLNDTDADARRLGDFAEQFPSKVNIIPMNPSELVPHQRPSDAEVDAFARKLWSRRTTVTVRYSKGLDIQAACGQLGYDQVRDKLTTGA